MDPLLRVSGLEVVYHTNEGRLKALSDVGFEVGSAEIVGIVGESGCGKSTVAASLLRLLPPNGQISAGELRFKDRDLLLLNSGQLRQLRGKDLAAIFQDPMTSLNPVFTIGTQMDDIQRAHLDTARLPQVELRSRVRQVLQRVGIPDADESIRRYPHQFSGGMRQRIMIAMALLSRPSLMIADEPTSSLDVTLEAQILELIKELRREYQASVLFISHDLGVIAQLCDRVIVMYAGRIVEQAPADTLFHDPQHPYTQALLAAIPSYRRRGQPLASIPGLVPSLFNLPAGCKFVDRCPLAQAVCHGQEPAIVETDRGQVRCYKYDPLAAFDQTAAAQANPFTMQAVSAAQPILAAPVRSPLSESRPLLRVSGLSTHYRERRGILEQLLRRTPTTIHAVDNVNFEIRRGEVVGLVGESGSGKTTLAKTLVGLIPSTSGRIEYDGIDLTRARAGELRRLRRRIQVVFQELYSSLSPRLRISYLLTEPYTIHRIPPADRHSASELLQMVGLSPEQAEKYPHELSGGQVRRVGIARALALRPEFLIADEPTSGLDVSVAAKILTLMKDLAARLGLTYLIITHNLNTVGYLSHRLAVMYLGILAELGPTDRVFEWPLHPYTLALLSAIPEPDTRKRLPGPRLLLQGEIPSPANVPPGCRFHTRCPYMEERCTIEVPALVEVEPDHYTACHFWQKVRALIEQGVVQAGEQQPPNHPSHLQRQPVMPAGGSDPQTVRDLDMSEPLPPGSRREERTR